eukprot:2353707-Rhodomonas_salina.2
MSEDTSDTNVQFRLELISSEGVVLPCTCEKASSSTKGQHQARRGSIKREEASSSAKRDAGIGFESTSSQGVVFTPEHSQLLLQLCFDPLTRPLLLTTGKDKVVTGKDKVVTVREIRLPRIRPLVRVSESPFLRPFQ